MGRSLDDLRRDQDAILAAYRAEREVAPVPDGHGEVGSAAGGCAFGRVTGIVPSDDTYGPHVLVVRQGWSGTPPVATDAAAAPARCYPLPGRMVGDFSVGDLVRMNHVAGAVLVEAM